MQIYRGILYNNPLGKMLLNGYVRDMCAKLYKMDLYIYGSLQIQTRQILSVLAKNMMETLLQRAVTAGTCFTVASLVGSVNETFNPKKVVEICLLFSLIAYTNISAKYKIIAVK